WTILLNVFLGGMVVAAGAWLAWDQLTLQGAGLVLALVTGFLTWQGRTIGFVWAWSTLFLGVESLIWPVITMAQVRAVTDQPSDQQMGAILSAVLMGLFSAVFWLSFSYGLLKRAGSKIVNSPESAETVSGLPSSPREKP